MVMLGSNMFYSSMLAYDILMKQVSSKVKMLKRARQTSTKRKTILISVGSNDHGNVNPNASSSSTVSRRKQAIGTCAVKQEKRTNQNVQIHTKYIRHQVKHNDQIHQTVYNDLRPEFQREQKQASSEWQKNEERQLREAFLTITDVLSQRDALDFRKAVCKCINISMHNFIHYN